MQYAVLIEENHPMENGIKDVVARLEKQKTAIDRALEALRGIEYGDGNQPGVEATEVGLSSGPERKGRMTPEGKKRLIAALKKRWAAKRAAEGTSASTAVAAPATKKRGMTAAGRKRLAEAMRKRWAVKRAGSSAVKRAGRKRAATPAAA
jgi:hypothetical protein